jgi:DNA-directed RNA polymerase subunit delta
MNKTNDSLSMLELAELFMREKNQNTPLQDIINYIFEVKGFKLNDFQKLNAFYLDLTHSAKFVFCGDNLWNLKENNLELWDKEGFAYVGDVDASEEDVEEDVEFTDFNIDDITLPSEEETLIEDDDEDEDEIEVIEDEDEIEAILEEKEYIDVKISMKSTDEDDGDDIDLDFDEDFDDEDYNEIMDDYEDMYDEE